MKTIGDGEFQVELTVTPPDEPWGLPGGVTVTQGPRDVLVPAEHLRAVGEALIAEAARRESAAIEDIKRTRAAIWKEPSQAWVPRDWAMAQGLNVEQLPAEGIYVDIAGVSGRVPGEKGTR